MLERLQVPKWLAGFMVIMVALGVAGCGDDDDSATPPGGDEKPGQVDGEATKSTGKRKSEFCLVAKKLRDAFNPDRYGEDDPEKVTATFQEFVEEYGADLDNLVKVAPDEIKVGAQAGVDAFRKAAEGDIAAIEKLGENEEAAKVSAYERANCAEGGTTSP